MNFRFFKNIALLSILLFSVFFFSATKIKASSDISLSSIEISEIEDGSAKLEWRTSGVRTKGVVYFGEDQDNLDRTFKYDSYDYNHEVILTKLEEDKTYFYKIVAIEKSGEKTEFFIRSFSTKDMIDTVRPTVSDFEAIQSAYGYSVLRWTTNEETRAVIEYGEDSNDLNKTKKVSGYNTENEIILSGLEEDVKYYVRLTVYDRDSNSRQKRISFTCYGEKEDAELSVSKITPVSYDEDLITSNTAEISFKTSLASKSIVYYGTDANKLKSSQVISSLRETKHTGIIEGLLPNTTYFYKIKVYDSPYRANLVTEVMSFTTGNIKNKYPSGSLLRAKGDLKVYFINGTTKAWITSPKVFLGLGYQSSWVQEVDQEVLNEYEEVSKITSYKVHPNGTLVKYANSATVYLIEDGKKRPFGSAEAFVKRGYNWGWIMIISNKETYKDGEYIS